MVITYKKVWWSAEERDVFEVGERWCSDRKTVSFPECTLLYNPFPISISYSLHLYPVAHKLLDSHSSGLVVLKQQVKIYNLLGVHVCRVSHGHCALLAPPLPWASVLYFSLSTSLPWRFWWWNALAMLCWFWYETITPLVPLQCWGQIASLSMRDVCIMDVTA